MQEFSPSSLKHLESVHPDLQTLFHYVVKIRDCTIVSGLRTQEEQQALYAQGRSVPGEIVTYKDGIERRSKHQTGLAVDVVPYPELYRDAYEMDQLARIVLGSAEKLKQQGKIDSEIEWGGFWRFKDRPHYEIRQ